MSELTMDKLVALAKNRGFVFPGSEIYGGLANSWDYGPLGSELKKNIKDAWWQKFIRESKYNVGIDAAIIMNPQVWVTTGHVGGFSDPLIDCKACKTRHRADNLIDDFEREIGELDEEIEDFSKWSFENGCPVDNPSNLRSHLLADPIDGEVYDFNDFVEYLNGSLLDYIEEIDSFEEGWMSGYSHYWTRELKDNEMRRFVKNEGPILSPEEQEEYSAALAPYMVEPPENNTEFNKPLPPVDWSAMDFVNNTKDLDDDEETEEETEESSDLSSYEKEDIIELLNIHEDGIENQLKEVFLSQQPPTITVGYWSYEYHHHKEIFQYHNKIRGNPNDVDLKWSLGKYDDQASGIYGMDMTVQPPIPYYAYFFKNGQMCDEIHSPRETELRFEPCENKKVELNR